MKSNCADVSGQSLRPDTAFGCPRDYLGNRFVYVVISSRLRGLSIGLNITPEVQCNYFCVYCEVARPAVPIKNPLDVEVMAHEFQRTLALVRSGEIAKMASFRHLPPELLALRQVVISGDGEPTMSPEFHSAVQRVIYLRAAGPGAFFKIVLFTNGSTLHLPVVQDALRFLTSDDEIWVKLDAGTQSYMTTINGPGAKLDTVLANIEKIGRLRPVGIQSLFPMINGQEPPPKEIDAYLARLNELKSTGANINMVQVFSSTSPARMTGCEYLPLRSLSHICHRIKTETGLQAEVF